MLFIAIFILKIGIGLSWEIGPFPKTFNEHCLASLAHMSVLMPYGRVWPLVSNFQIKKISILRLALLPCQ